MNSDKLYFILRKFVDEYNIDYTWIPRRFRITETEFKDDVYVVSTYTLIGKSKVYAQWFFSHNVNNFYGVAASWVKTDTLRTKHYMVFKVKTLNPFNDGLLTLHIKNVSWKHRFDLHYLMNIIPSIRFKSDSTDARFWSLTEYDFDDGDDVFFVCYVTRDDISLLINGLTHSLNCPSFIAKTKYSCPILCAQKCSLEINDHLMKTINDIWDQDREKWIKEENKRYEIIHNDKKLLIDVVTTMMKDETDIF